MEIESKIKRKYIFSQKELKELLKIKGNILEFNLCSGLSPNDKEKGVSMDNNNFQIVTNENITSRE